MVKRPNVKGRIEAPGGFAGVPRIVMGATDYHGLSFKAKALLLDLSYQFKGANNGNLTAALSVLRHFGWSRSATISAAIQELMAANLVIRTREGRFVNPGARCALYGVTWQPINECPSADLDHPPTIRPPRQFSLEAQEINRTPVTLSVIGADATRNEHDQNRNVLSNKSERRGYRKRLFLPIHLLRKTFSFLVIPPPVEKTWTLRTEHEKRTADIYTIRYHRNAGVRPCLFWCAGVALSAVRQKFSGGGRGIINMVEEAVCNPRVVRASAICELECVVDSVQGA